MSPRMTVMKRDKRRNAIFDNVAAYLGHPSSPPPEEKANLAPSLDRRGVGVVPESVTLCDGIAASSTGTSGPPPVTLRAVATS